MNQVLADILQSKRSLGRDGKSSIDVHSSISVEEGELLARLIAERKPIPENGTSWKTGQL